MTSAFIINLLFLPFVNSQVVNADVIDANQLEKFEDQLKCGTANNKCCNNGNIDINFKIPHPDIPVVGWIFDRIVSPINAIFSLVGNQIVNTTANFIKHTFGAGEQPKCFEGNAENIGGECRCIVGSAPSLANLCKTIHSSNEKTDCLSCVQ
ncbi:MAG: hypothetical protein AAB966_04405, partial [Patescibacteria group bacterium]